MIDALVRAIGLLFDRRVLGLLGLCTALSLVCFVGAWYGIDFAITAWLGDESASITVLRVLGGLATLVLAWLLFPVLMSAFVALFLDSVATIVERRDYPWLPSAPGLPWHRSLWCSLRFLGVMLGANVLLLALLLFPLAYPVAYFVVNGWLLGREYFELVALRRLDPAAGDALRQRHGVELLATGAALTLLMTLPIVNLVLPIVATAVMVHRFEQWRTTHAGGG